MHVGADAALADDLLTVEKTRQLWCDQSTLEVFDVDARTLGRDKSGHG